jgi:ketosteroid isomerase-like protein
LAAGLVLVWLSVWFLFGCRPGSCSAVHETADPEVIVAEFDYEGRVTTTGHAFRFSNVQFVRVRDGLIAETRDYHDHARIGAALSS